MFECKVKLHIRIGIIYILTNTLEISTTYISIVEKDKRGQMESDLLCVNRNSLKTYNIIIFQLI